MTSTWAWSPSRWTFGSASPHRLDPTPLTRPSAVLRRAILASNVRSEFGGSVHGKAERPSASIRGRHVQGASDFRCAVSRCCEKTLLERLDSSTATLVAIVAPRDMASRRFWPSGASERPRVTYVRLDPTHDDPTILLMGLVSRASVGDVDLAVGDARQSQPGHRLAT